MAENERKSYRIRTAVGNEAPASVSINLSQTYENIDVLSLEIKQSNFYKMPSADYGVIIGRVLANEGFGIPNAKISVFIPYEGNSLDIKENVLYNYTSTSSRNQDGVRYNLLPRTVDEECHQDVGTMFEKEFMLDNNDVIKVFEKYYKYTTVTNQAGDYFIYGVPVGTQTIHVDIDLSDIGILSQRPRDMVYKGYDINLFENPNKFKKSTNLNSLAQIYTQDRSVQVYPFWGDTTDDETNGTITRCDINIDYKFEPTCVFMGSIISDTGSRAISHRCVPDDEMGKMSELVTGEGTIEMIRKTFDGKVEQFSIKGNKLIDGEGVWCYQIPMNLDYVITDEFGNMVPTDNPNKGIPTRTRVRFRIGMDEVVTDDTARKRARFLVPNNPRLTSDYPDFMESHVADYEFGTFTKEESYRDMFWNKVYTVKSYIPRLQKARALRRRVHTGIKNVSHYGSNNPFPYNNLFIRLTFTYTFLCQLLKFIFYLVAIINFVNSTIASITYFLLSPIFVSVNVLDKILSWLNIDLKINKIFCPIYDLMSYLVISLPNLCTDGNEYRFSPGVIGWYKQIMENIASDDAFLGSSCTINYNGNYDDDYKAYFNCIENELIQDQECTSFNFQNDWINGSLYAPLWFRKVKSKKKLFFGLFTRKAKDKWCNGDDNKMSSKGNGLTLCQTCAQRRTINNNSLNALPKSNENVSDETNCYGYRCHKKAVSFIKVNNGLVIQKQTILGEDVYYYKSVEYDNTNLFRFPVDSNGDSTHLGEVKLLFATDLVLLGSLNNCDTEGVPQFFKSLESTSYNMPSDLLSLDYDVDDTQITYYTKTSTIADLIIPGVTNILNHLGLFLNEPDEINENNGMRNVHTNQTGADWGNYGYDQTKETLEDSGKEKYTYASDGVKEDYGGLFYGVNCWTSYTKPKSCVNLTRICEFGVSLDESEEFYNFSQMNAIENETNDYTVVAPDGFISYDELYNLDGRAMFATMNGNNLRTIINSKNGFPVYDFLYLYPENFDGSLHNLMRLDNSIPSPQNGNYSLEVNSDSYMRFRYGNTPIKGDFSVNYYSSKIPLYGLYKDSYAKNYGRFPRYENSFYFYFGLIPGKTAIEKFRTQYYSECQDDESEQSVVNFNYTANNWCNNYFDEETGQAIGDGWLSIDATYVSTPYNLKFENLSGFPEYNIEVNDVTEPKIYFAYDSISELENEGYVRLITSEHENRILVNGYYRFIVVDSEGNEFVQPFNFVDERITFDLDSVNFRYSNSVLNEKFPNDTFYTVATLGHEQSIPREYEPGKPLGGTITVSNIMKGNEVVDSFEIRITPNDANIVTRIPIQVPDAYDEHQQERGWTLTSYSGSYVRVVCGEIDETCTHSAGYETLMYGYSLDDGYSFTFGVPYGGISYNVTVTQLCADCPDTSTVTRSSNVTTKNVRVFEPLEFKMYINGIDYNVIKRFTHGWQVTQDGPTSPYFAFYPYDNLDTSQVVGWVDIMNDGGLEVLPPADSNTQYSDISSVATIVSSTETPDCPYAWSDTYVFDPSSFITESDKFLYVPDTKQGESDFIMVFSQDDEQYYFYHWETWHYVLYNGGVTAITLEQFFDDNSSIEIKNEIIDGINEIVVNRQEYIRQVYEAFTKKSSNEPYSLTVTYQTRETPVKTLIYYSPDLEGKTSTESEKLDDELWNNSVEDIMVPTITGRIVGSSGLIKYPPVSVPDSLEGMGYNTFTKIDVVNGVSFYKKPFFAGIENSADEHITEEMGSVENPDRTKMFGIHIIDKTISLVYNSWNCIDNWPFFNDSYIYGTTDPSDSSVWTTPVYRCGLFAGFILNGLPERYDYNNNILETYFKTQELSHNFNIHTISQDSAHNPLEERIPTVRFIYDENRQSTVFGTYSVSDRLPMDEYKQVLLIEKETDALHISDNIDYDKYWKVSVEPKPTTISYTKIGRVINENETKFYYSGTLTFDNYNGKYAFFKNKENPVYTSDSNDLLTFSNGYDMTFQKTLPSTFETSNSIGLYSVYTNDASTDIWIQTNANGTPIFVVGGSEPGYQKGPSTVYALYTSEDEMTRSVTKTYDVRPVEVAFKKRIVLNNTHYDLYINVGGIGTSSPDSDMTSTLYPYLKHYTFTVDIYETYEEEELEYFDFSLEIPGGFQTATGSTPYKYVRNTNGNFIVYENLETIYESFDENKAYSVYITDVLGLRHLAINVENDADFCPFVK